MGISQCSEYLVGTVQTPVTPHALSIKFPLQTYKQCSFLTPFDEILKHRTTFRFDHIS